MANKMHLNESFVKEETNFAKLNEVDLHIKEVLGESIWGEHLPYVNINAFECETPCEGFVLRSYDNPNNS
jgi:hypothetical protein